MANYDSNYAIAQEISARIGASPVPFNSVYDIALAIYQELGGTEDNFDSVYSILLGILPLAEGQSGDIADLKQQVSALTEDVSGLTSDVSGLTQQMDGKQNILAAGTGIEISGDTISCTVSGATYTAGQNISIDSANTISAEGYVFNSTSGTTAMIYRQDAEDGGQLVVNTVSGSYGSTAEGYGSTASGNYAAHAEGVNTTSSGGQGSHSEGYKSVASGMASHAEGITTTAETDCSHTEGEKTRTTGGSNKWAQHAEGFRTIASGIGSHSEGNGHANRYNEASGDGSHAEGIMTVASGLGSHAEGYGGVSTPNTASGDGTHAEGILTIAQNASEHAEGACNVSHSVNSTQQGFGNSGNTLHSIGISTNPNARANAIEVMQNADMYIKGVGGYDGVHIKGQDSGITVQTVQEVISGINTSVAGKQDSLTAGQNITISGTTISASVPQIEAGENIEIVDGKINATGYLFSKKSFVELPEDRTEFFQELPVSQVGMTDLKLSGNAGATTYSYSGESASMFDSYVDIFVEIGYGLQVGDTVGYIVAADTTNKTVTLSNTLDADNALSNGLVTALVLNIVVTVSGESGATTYNVTETPDAGLFASLRTQVQYNLRLYVEGYGWRKVSAVANDGSTVTFEQTLDANNAISNVRVESATIDNNKATAQYSHAEGRGNVASGYCSHAEGGDIMGMLYHTTAAGNSSHAEGRETTAVGDYSHTEGFGTTTQNESEHAEGKYNISHVNANNASGCTQHSVGIGYRNDSRRNAFEIMQNGDVYVYGIGNYAGTDIKASGNTVQTLKDVLDSKADAYEVATNAEIDAMFA